MVSKLSITPHLRTQLSCNYLGAHCDHTDNCSISGCTYPPPSDDSSLHFGSVVDLRVWHLWHRHAEEFAQRLPSVGYLENEQPVWRDCGLDLCIPFVKLLC
mmetsp:Transcript_72620/g.121148  ORF Transcript_72620/g.121148 Transcript_72620/m.121148 type:complete len:101 (+) Transcript_72620:159-461(+)